MTKKSRQKFKYRENEESFYDEIKNIFIIFKGLSLKQTKRIWKVKVRIERFKNLVGCRLGHLQKWFILILRNVNITAQKLKFFHDGFLQQIWWTKQEIVNLVMLTEEVLNPFIHDVKKGSNMVKVGLKHG